LILAQYKKYGVLLIAILVGNAWLNLIPWTFLFVVLGALAVLIIADQVGWKGLNVMLSPGSETSSSDEPDFQIEPWEAPEKLNEKLRKSKGRKEIDIDTTSPGNLNFKESLAKARIDGTQYWVWWVVGRVKSGYHDEVISYIYDLTEDRIVHSNQNVKDPVHRVEPFSDKPSWLVVEGITGRKPASDGRADIQVNYGPDGRNGTSGNGGGS